MALWQAAYQWLCRQRRRAPASADVWHVRFHWATLGPALFRRVTAGDYRLSAMQLVGRSRAERRAQWCAQDALVLKWVALKVESLLPTHARCAHLKGQGCHRSVAEVSQAQMSGEYAFVYRTDIRGYYRHIRKEQVMRLVAASVPCQVLRGLLNQYLYYSVEDAGEFYTPDAGINRGCALSPLIGASLLYHVDTYFSTQRHLFYVRYMDDFLVLARTRWPLRRAVKALHNFLNLAGFETHPDKTQLGRIENGFDWLGVWFSGEAPEIAPRALENHRIRRLRLYEQARGRGLCEEAAEARVRAYETRWKRWVDRLMSC
ncbi:transposase [Serratia marcescens]|nr:transposase [Serratia marcescens]EJC6395432.1 transposase [Serratia marcescens]